VTSEKLIRRFPPPVPGLPTSEDRYKTILSTLAELDNPTRNEFVGPCQAAIQKHHDDSLSESWTKHIISDLTRSGFISEEKLNEADEQKRLQVGIDSQAYLNEDIQFADCVYRALKRGWVLRAQHPEGFEALERILHAITYEFDEPVSSRVLKQTLENQYEYQFSQQGLRGYPEILCQMEYLVDTEDGYAIHDGSDPTTALQRLRNADLFRKYENLLKREGALVENPDPRTKQALMKYYMYRESGGWSKRKLWYRQFHNNYLTPSAQEATHKRPELDRKEEFKEVEDRRSRLRGAIVNQFNIDKRRLTGLSVDDLQRITEAAAPEEARQALIQCGSGVTRADLKELSGDQPYTFNQDFSLYDWQADAVDTWFTGTDDTKPQSGIAEVVTGAGKTVMALGVIRRWVAENNDGVVTVVVPTKVLMYQWLSELTQKLNVPVDEIGWAGDGHRDAFEIDGIRVLVTIVNTAVKDDYLASCLDGVDTPPHLLIADECHNYTGDVHSNVLTYHSTSTLGLSATPTEKPQSERDLSPDEESMFEQLGNPFYTLTYSEAIDRGLIPSFKINYVGFSLTQKEREAYDSMSREITDLLKDIRARYSNRLFQLSGNLHQKLNVIHNSDDGNHSKIGQFFTLTQERRELVQNAVARQAITLELLRRIDSDEKAIVFQERIEQLKQLVAPHEQLGQTREREIADGSAGEYRSQLYEDYPELETVDKEVEELFADPDYWPVMYHSGHRRQIWNDFAMEWFRADDHANVMLSVKALIEGVDVPDADTGIIRVSSGSVRQRIQTLGRILRTGDDPEKQSDLYVLYARETVDENIFREYDWEDQLGSAEVEHYQWVTDGSVLDGEFVIGERPDVTSYEEPEYPDIDDLEPGDSYDGPRRGYKISVNAEGRPFEKTRSGRRFITSNEVKVAASIVHRLKGGGSIIINDRGHMLTNTKDDTVFLGQREGTDSFEYDDTSQQPAANEPVEFDDIFGDE